MYSGWVARPRKHDPGWSGSGSCRFDKGLHDEIDAFWGVAKSRKNGLGGSGSGYCQFDAKIEKRDPRFVERCPDSSNMILKGLVYAGKMSRLNMVLEGLVYETRGLIKD